MKYFFLFLGLSAGLHLSAQQVTSGGKLKPEQAIMDIRHYTITLDVDIDNHSINGYTVIDFETLQPAKTLLFDLLDSFKVESVILKNRKQEFSHKNNLITISLPAEIEKGRYTVKIQYSGRPPQAANPPWGDGFTWTKDSTGHPWIAITAQASGGKIYFPCKDHPSDEPNEGADLLITVPKGLVVAGPGLLKKVTTKNEKSTYHWSTHYTINNYSILFNVGNYKVVTREFTTVNGNKVPMEFYVLEEHASRAAHHLDLLEDYAHVREKYFGEYPWIKEKIGIVETPHLGMEHQTMNAYGNKFRYTKQGGKDYDWLMNHEFGHEWWGNKVTVSDWADYWIHEGIDTFGDHLYLENTGGTEAYNELFQGYALSFGTEKPIVQGKDIDEGTAYNSDIYYKGAFFMHSLRFVLGDSIFFPLLKQFVTNPKYTYDNLVTTDDVEQYFSSNSGKNLKPLFDQYLRTTDRTEIYIKRTMPNSYEVSLQNLDMSIPLQVATSEGLEIITINKQPVTIVSNTMPIIDPNTFYFTRIVVE